jgi:translation initiation factor IF-3
MAIIPPSSSGSGIGGPGGSGGPSGSGPSFPRPRFPRGAYPPPSKDEHRINERIRVPQVRLIDEKGEQVGVVPTFEALRIARERGLDLMEISPNAQPPVCKICDYGKFKYEKKKKEHEARKKQTVIKVKEVQLRPQTDEHDRNYKFKNIRTFLEEGDKAKITIMFRGREITYVEHGYKIMRQLAEMVQDIAVVESPAKLEGKKLIMVLAPGQAKKGSKAVVSGPTPNKVSGPVPNKEPAAATAASAPAADTDTDAKKAE